MTDSASRPHLLLTNDDGIDAPGLAAMREELRAVGEVTVVAPAADQSGRGRTRNDTAVRREHPWGHALEGTPADCVAYGLCGLDEPVDLVVSGINSGPNAGNYVVGRSGTVGAGVEAAFLGTDAVAVSGYHAADFYLYPPDEYEFARPARLARRLVERALGTDLFEEVDLLNVNAPVDVESPPFRVTRPQPDYDLRVEHGVDVGGDRELADGEEAVRLADSVWPGVSGWENPFPVGEEHRERYPVGTDRRALMEGEVSVSPLSVSHGHAHRESEALAAVLAELNGPDGADGSVAGEPPAERADRTGSAERR